MADPKAVVLTRIDRLTRGYVQDSGDVWPNGQAYKPEHPDYFFVSTAWDERESGNRNSYPPGDEKNLPGFPWWMMSRKYGFPDTG